MTADQVQKLIAAAKPQDWQSLSAVAHEVYLKAAVTYLIRDMRVTTVENSESKASSALYSDDVNSKAAKNPALVERDKDRVYASLSIMLGAKVAQAAGVPFIQLGDDEIALALDYGRCLILLSEKLQYLDFALNLQKAALHNKTDVPPKVSRLNEFEHERLINALRLIHEHHIAMPPVEACITVLKTHFFNHHPLAEPVYGALRKFMALPHIIMQPPPKNAGKQEPGLG